MIRLAVLSTREPNNSNAACTNTTSNGIDILVLIRRRFPHGSSRIMPCAKLICSSVKFLARNVGRRRVVQCESRSRGSGSSFGSIEQYPHPSSVLGIATAGSRIGSNRIVPLTPVRSRDREAIALMASQSSPRRHNHPTHCGLPSSANWVRNSRMYWVNPSCIVLSATRVLAEGGLFGSTQYRIVWRSGQGLWAWAWAWA